MRSERGLSKPTIPHTVWSGISSYLGEVSLDLVAGVDLLADLVGECVVALVPVEQHQVGGLLQQVLDAIPHVT